MVKLCCKYTCITINALNEKTVILRQQDVANDFEKLANQKCHCRQCIKEKTLLNNKTKAIY